jgi:hypothetical protein
MDLACTVCDSSETVVYVRIDLTRHDNYIANPIFLVRCRASVRVVFELGVIR